LKGADFPYYPKQVDQHRRGFVLSAICSEINAIAGSAVASVNDLVLHVSSDDPVYIAQSFNTEFDCTNRTIRGRVTENTEIARNQLRRHGIRFRCSPDMRNGVREYVPWESS
jgi:hypothetical protein